MKRYAIERMNIIRGRNKYMLDVISLGETMVLFTPTNSGSLKYATYFRKQIGGAESNFAIGLARLGYKTGWISKVGNDSFGEYIVSFIRGEGVDTSRVKVDKTVPTGVYFKEFHETKATKVFYYRKDSAASHITPDDLDEEYIASAKYFHITGITPVLSESARQTVLKAIDIAKKNNVKISFDPNIRKKLCSEQMLKKCILEVLYSADVVFPGYEEAKFLLYDDSPEALCKEILNLGPKIVAMKLGKDGCIVANKNTMKYVKGVKIDRVVDTIGAGDGFDAGFVAGLLQGLDIVQCGKFANEVGAFVTTVVGDVEGLPTIDDIKEFRGEVDIIER